MIEIGVSNLTKAFGADKIFENITFDIKTKDKIGLIGRNGIGKTTLMRILAGREDYQAGQVNRRKELTIGYLEQIPSCDDGDTVLDVLNEAFSELNEITMQMKKYERSFDNLNDNDLKNAVDKYSLLHEQYEALGGYDINEKLGKILTGLKISDDLQKRKFNLLSGGEKTRVILGKILLEEPELLLLDEPSNHLDIKSVEWLEEYLISYVGTIVIVSHDRYFLDRVVNKIIEIEPDCAQIYYGGYSKYAAEKELRFLQAMKEYNSQQKKIKRMEEQIQRYRIWGEMRDSDKMYKRAKELEKRLETIDRINKPVFDKKAAKFQINNTERTGKEVIKVTEIKKVFGNNKLFDRVSFTLYYKDSLCLLGENGSGKSTILKIIMNEISPDSGGVRIGSKVKIGYLPQEVVFDRENISIIDYFSYHYGISLSETRRELAKISFVDEDVYKIIGDLSGGEKSRLRLGMLIYEDVNTLILDEPTNHLDIESREMLEESLIKFEGTLLFVSHDRYFVDRIATCIGEIENKRFSIYRFNYEGYKQEKQKTEAYFKETMASTQKGDRLGKKAFDREKEEKRAREKSKRDLARLEGNIIESEKKVAELEKKLNTDSSEWDISDYNNKYNEYTQLKDSIECMYTELYKLSEEVEND